MFSTKEGIFTSCLFILLVVSAIGGYAGFSVGGINYEINTDSPVDGSEITWAGNSLDFFFSMVSMRVDDMPWPVEVFFQFLTGCMIGVVVWTVRGN